MAKEAVGAHRLCGLALITLGLGCFQVMLDRGENEDWFGSRFILLMAVLGGLGILGAIGWLLIAKKPVVNLHVFKDRNFAMGCVFIGATGGTLYAGAVVIPQFAQSVIGYTATWAGLILSPGGIVVILLYPDRGAVDENRSDPLHHSGRVLHHGIGIPLFEHARA
jgi:MFS transporter, DHA2 family, multidrug resistance protein